jgi:hypothetical protein
MKLRALGAAGVTPAAKAATLPATKTSGQRTFLQVLGEGSPRARPTPPARAAQAPTPPPADQPARPGLADRLSRALEGAARDEARIDAILEAAARGKTFTAAELLAMQATVFRYSQTVEVLSRATDRLGGAVKQALGTSV